MSLLCKLPCAGSIRTEFAQDTLALHDGHFLTAGLLNRERKLIAQLKSAVDFAFGYRDYLACLFSRMWDLPTAGRGAAW